MWKCIKLMIIFIYRVTKYNTEMIKDSLRAFSLEAFECCPEGWDVNDLVSRKFIGFFFRVHKADTTAPINFVS